MIAGCQDGGRTPEEVARAEAWEEAGYRLGALEHIATVYPSPGGSSERMHLYLAPATSADRQASGGGLPGDGEDILVREFTMAEAQAMVADGRIMDAKTVLALQYLALNWDRLRA
jgi:nudix-type nucleoside diphosphatase (YffH/AdpP family)